MDVRILRASPADVPALARLLARAFDGDPVANWVLRQDARRAAAFDSYYRLTVRLAMPHGHVYRTEDWTGAALWAPPGRWRDGRLRQVWRLPAFVRAVGARRFPRLLPALLALEARHPETPHYYLFELAVDPPFQGRGIGGALLRHVLETCDREGTPAYLESSSARNLPLYERHGFRARERHRIGGEGPPVWLMWREPRRPAGRLSPGTR